MQAQRVIFSILRHNVAAVASAAFLIVVSIATYFICAAIGNDAGGPIVPFLIPLFCIIGGVGTATVVYFPFSLLLAWISRRMQFASWISLAAFFVLAFLFFAGWLAVVWQRVPSFSEFGLAALCGLFFTGGFTIYWLVLSFSRRLFRGHEAAA
jgi:hypothetical protein